MKHTSSYNITIDFRPWFDNGFILKSLHIYEELGGNIAYGKIDMELVGTEESLTFVTKQYTGKLIIERNRGNNYEIDVFITRREYYKNTLSLDFLCIKDKKFYTDLVSLEYTDISSALNSLYPGKIDIRCESDINNNIPLIQNTETNHSFCTKLAYAYKKDSIFAFGWDGFMIKDRIGIDSRGNNEPKLALIGGLGAESMDRYGMNYDSMIFEKSWDPWGSVEGEESKYEELMPLNSRTIKLYDTYLTVGVDYCNLVENYLYNKTKQESKYFNVLRVKLNDIADYRLGDVIFYKHTKEKNIPYKTYLVRSNEFFYSASPDKKDSEGNSIFWVSKLLALDWEGTTMPEVDLINNLNSEGSIE